MSENAAENAPETENQPLEVLTAFTVVVDLTGKAWVLTDVIPEGLQVSGLANSRLIEAACKEVSDDIRVGDLALRVAQLLTPVPEPTQQERIQEALRKRKEDDGD